MQQSRWPPSSPTRPTRVHLKRSEGNSTESFFTPYSVRRTFFRGDQIKYASHPSQDTLWRCSTMKLPRWCTRQHVPLFSPCGHFLVISPKEYSQWKRLREYDGFPLCSEHFLCGGIKPGVYLQRWNSQLKKTVLNSCSAFLEIHGFSRGPSSDIKHKVQSQQIIRL